MSESSNSLERAALELLEEAFGAPSGEQRAFIEAKRDVEPEVRALALAMLASESAGSDPLRTGGAGEILQASDPPPPELDGYRIIRPLGRGGMGVVYLAERDSSDFEHRVAIKVIKHGVLVDTLVERFIRERQILAQLNHPHIAHLHDGGETAEGQPYIIMEYVQGQTLRDWLLEEDPSLDRRLALFLQIAQAVEFAHQNLVIHRDLTPGNVLVKEGDQAKLIDFGIARPQVDDSAEVAASRFSGLSLTPGFGAPERAEGLASNTLTDVYSLGQILRHMVGCYEEAELDAIAARAAAEQPQDRYGSVSEMIDEVRSYQAGLPVAAFAESSSYRLRKFVQRERTLVGAAMAVLLAIVIGLIGTTWAYNRAENSRQMAEQRFTELRELARFQLFDLYDEMNSVIGNTTARLALAEQSQQYLVSLAESRPDDVDLQLETAEGFIRLAVIQGIAAHPNFGEFELAAQNLDRAEAILQPLSSAGMARADTALASLEAYRALHLAHTESQPPEALEAVGRAEAALERVPASARGWDWMQARRNARLAALEWADLELDTDRIARYAQLMVQDMGEWPPERRSGYEHAFDTAQATYYRAIVQHNQGTPEGYANAVAGYLDADGRWAALEESYPNDPDVLYWRGWNAYYGYAAAATLLDDVTANRLLQQARDSVARLITIEEADQSLATFDERLREAQAEFFSNTGRHGDAIALMQSVIDGREAKLARNPTARSTSDLAYGRAIFGAIHRKAGNRAQACENWTQAEQHMAVLESRDELSGYVENLRAGVQANLARCAAGEPVSSFTELAQ